MNFLLAYPFRKPIAAGTKLVQATALSTSGIELKAPSTLTNSHTEGNTSPARRTRLLLHKKRLRRASRTLDTNMIETHHIFVFLRRQRSKMFRLHPRIGPAMVESARRSDARADAHAQDSTKERWKNAKISA